MSEAPPDAITEAIRLIAADKWRAHQIIFRHRHQTEGRETLAATIRSVVRASLAAAERDDGERRRIALAGAAELSRLAGR